VSDDVITGINGEPLGTIRGGRVGVGAERGGVGTLMSGRSATDANIRAALKFWLQGDASDFAMLGGGDHGRVDKATGQVFDPLISDPPVLRAAARAGRPVHGRERRAGVSAQA
jgi:hypothetical protein